MHTRVDIAEDDLLKPQTTGNKAKKQSASVSRLTFSSRQDKVGSSTKFREDIFRFYNLNVELPKTFFTKLGDSKIVTSDAISLAKLFIQSEWPVLA